MDRLLAIRLFIRVVNLGSFSKAAADIGMGQPSATKLVAQMEKQLGSRLLHRSTHGVTPTEIGALYYEKCKLIAHHVDEAETVAALLQSQVQGGLRISTSVAFGRRVLAPLVMRFMWMNPKLQIDLSFEDRYVNLVEQGVDVAIRMGRLADSSLGARYLGVNPWVVVASADYLDKRGTPRDAADLAAHDALIYSTVQGDARWHFTGVDGQAVSVPVRGPLRSNSLSALLAAAREGMGVAALPWYVAQESVRSGAVLPLLADWKLPSQEIHAVYPSPRLVPAKVSGFVEWLQGQFGEAWWAGPEEERSEGSLPANEGSGGRPVFGEQGRRRP
ncbi:MAG: LysR family transcriptional regulator [Methylibium sp.]|nr:LysR family transcriptional regulator [Methylibium sp.]